MILCMDIYKEICIGERFHLVTKTPKTQFLGGAVLPAAEDLVRTWPQRLRGSHRRHQEPVSCKTIPQKQQMHWEAEPWPSFRDQLWNSCWAQQGLPLSCDNRTGLCISALAEAVECWAIPVLVLDSCRDHDPGHLAWEMMDSTWLSPRNHDLSSAFFKQGLQLLGCPWTTVTLAWGLVLSWGKFPLLWDWPTSLPARGYFMRGWCWLQSLDCSSKENRGSVHFGEEILVTSEALWTFGTRIRVNLLFLLHVFPWGNDYKMVLETTDKKINVELGRGA